MTTKILHRSYFHNDFIFVRPAVSTDYIENDEPAAQPTYRAYYPTRETLRETWLRIVTNFQLRARVRGPRARRRPRCMAAVDVQLGACQLRANFQIQVLSSLFFRNKGAYVVGKIINGFYETPFALPILHGERGGLVIDAALFGEDDLQLVFSFARAYFMVDDGGAVGLRAVPALADAAQAALRALQRARACRSRARASSTATS